MWRTYGTCVFSLLACCAASLVLQVSEANAHYDGDPTRQRHMYSVAASNNACYLRRGTPTDAGMDWVACGPTTVGAYDDVRFGAADWWEVQYTNSANGVKYWINFAYSEWHCPLGTFFHSHDNGCMTATDQCAPNIGNVISWTTDAAPLGFNAPSDALEAPFNGGGGCSFTRISSTVNATNGTLFDVSYAWTGGQEIDEDGTPYSDDDGNVYDDCIPASFDMATGNVATDFGQTGLCDVDGIGSIDSDGDGVADSIDTCPVTPAGESVDATGCGCVTQAGSCGVAGMIDLSGVESRLDQVNANLDSLEAKADADKLVQDVLHAKAEENALQNDEMIGQLNDLKANTDGIEGKLDGIKTAIEANDPECQLSSCVQTVPTLGAHDNAEVGAMGLYSRIENAPIVSAVANLGVGLPVGVCPTGSTAPLAALDGHVVTLDGHCTIIDDIKSELQSVMLAVWVLLSAMLILRA